MELRVTEQWRYLIAKSDKDNDCFLFFDVERWAWYSSPLDATRFHSQKGAKEYQQDHQIIADMDKSFVKPILFRFSEDSN